jgi:hypothetical protein
VILLYAVAQRGNLYPDVYNCLRSLPDIALQHGDHGLRHPLGIYSISFQRVIQAFQNVLVENEKVYHVPLKEDEAIDFDTVPLLKAQQELLDSLMAHIDDGYQILKALYPASRLTKSVPFADKWLEQAKHPTVAQYKHLIKPYRDTIAPIVNRMKHEHGRLRALIMRNFDQPQNTQQRIVGYFVEGVDKHGTVGPDTKIHGKDRAISFHRDLRYHFVHLYKVDHFLSEAIVEAINKTYSGQFTPSVYFDTPSSEIIAIAESITHLPFLFFFDEVSKLTPTVGLSPANQNVKLTLNDTNKIKAASLLRWKVQIKYMGDNVTKSWIMPYIV